MRNPKSWLRNWLRLHRYKLFTFDLITQEGRHTVCSWHYPRVGWERRSSSTPLCTTHCFYTCRTSPRSRYLLKPHSYMLYLLVWFRGRIGPLIGHIWIYTEPLWRRHFISVSFANCTYEIHDWIRMGGGPTILKYIKVYPRHQIGKIYLYFNIL